MRRDAVMLKGSRTPKLLFGLSLAAAAASTALIASRSNKRGERAHDAQSDNEWDRVDQASYDSFPASDPPSYCIRSRYD